MAIITRRYRALGPTNANLAEFVGPSAVINAMYPLATVDVDIDDAIPGLIETLDIEYAKYGLIFDNAAPITTGILCLENGVPIALTPFMIIDFLFNGLTTVDMGGGILAVATNITIDPVTLSGNGTPSSPLAVNQTSSLAAAAGAFGDIDFSVLGTVDWCVIDVVNDLPSGNSWHSKQTAGWLMRNFRWKTDGTARTSVGPLAQTMTSLAPDDCIIPPLTATAQMERGISKVGANATLDLGFSTALPCSPVPRTVLIQGTIFSVNLRIAARLSENLAAPVSINADAGGARAGAAYRAEITFSGPLGTWCYIDAQVVTVYGGGVNNFYVGQLACS